MPIDKPPNPNGKKPPESLHFERTQVTCQRCKRVFEHYVIEEIDNLAQLRCGDVLITRAEMVCLHCGWSFHWDVKRKALEEMAIIYGAIVKRLYSAE
jgi:hypothetical protein